MHSVIYYTNSVVRIATSFLQRSKTIKAFDIGDCYTKVKEYVQVVISDPVRKDWQSMDSALTDVLIDCFEAHG